MARPSTLCGGYGLAVGQKTEGCILKNWFWKDDKSGWEAFGEQGGMSLNAALANVAGELSRLSSDYGQIDLPETRIAAFNLRLPPPETAEINDFLDMG